MPAWSQHSHAAGKFSFKPCQKQSQAICLTTCKSVVCCHAHLWIPTHAVSWSLLVPCTSQLLWGRIYLCCDKSLDCGIRCCCHVQDRAMLSCMSAPACRPWATDHDKHVLLAGQVAGIKAYSLPLFQQPWCDWGVHQGHISSSWYLPYKGRAPSLCWEQAASLWVV